MSRPFDLEKAKRGEPICWRGGLPCRHIDGPDQDDVVAVWYKDRIRLTESNNLRMAPLVVVKQKDVYPGDDELYLNGTKVKVLSKASWPACGDLTVLHKGLKISAFIKDLAWTPPPKTEEVSLWRDSSQFRLIPADHEPFYDDWTRVRALSVTTEGNVVVEKGEPK